jgi:hypothetical protein
MATRWDELEIDLKGRVVRHIASNRELRFDPIPEWDMKVIEAGGFVEFLRRSLDDRAS